ncbi:YrrS family protein [Indiicoccus explosivorum]|uniref:YrrS family protein n=1 Tax=Indiicoccus explosivorum TaxID=1917864 RepID=UPI000B431B3B|nr:YrrS family protein [Indiicoccus explosivorum]
MPNHNKHYPSRMDRRNRTNSLLNILIVLVFGLIAITAAFIIIGGGSDEPELEQVTVSDNPAEADQEESAEEGGGGTGDPAAGSDEQEAEPEAEEPTVGGTITREDSADPLVKETIVNTGWEPIGTEQTGEHVSRYDGSSADWQEKLEAIAYATGLNADEMIVWMIENGGGPQKSVGVVSNSANTEHFRVYLQWVDGEGWKPEKVDVLTTAEGAY